MRPKSVERFEILYLMSLGIGLVSSALNWEQSVQMAGVKFVAMVLGVTLIVSLSLVLLISRKGSNIARWALLVLFLLGVLMYIPSMSEFLAQNPFNVVLSTVQILLQVAAIYFVFRPDAKPWFQKKST